MWKWTWNKSTRAIQKSPHQDFPSLCSQVIWKRIHVALLLPRVLSPAYMYEVSVSKINDFFSLYYRSLWDQRWHFERKFCNSLGCHSIMNTTTMGKEASLDGLGKSIIHTLFLYTTVFSLKCRFDFFCSFTSTDAKNLQKNM